MTSTSGTTSTQSTSTTSAPACTANVAPGPQEVLAPYEFDAPGQDYPTYSFDAAVRSSIFSLFSSSLPSGSTTATSTTNTITVLSSAASTTASAPTSITSSTSTTASSPSSTTAKSPSCTTTGSSTSASATSPASTTTTSAGSTTTTPFATTKSSASASSPVTSMPLAASDCSYRGALVTTLGKATDSFTPQCFCQSTRVAKASSTVGDDQSTTFECLIDGSTLAVSTAGPVTTTVSINILVHIAAVTDRDKRHVYTESLPDYAGRFAGPVDVDPINTEGSGAYGDFLSGTEITLDLATTLVNYFCQTPAKWYPYNDPVIMQQWNFDDTDSVFVVQATWPGGCHEPGFSKDDYFPLGDPSSPNYQQCQSELMAVLNGCDTGVPTEKIGGSVMLGCVIWTAVSVSNWNGVTPAIPSQVIGS